MGGIYGDPRDTIIIGPWISRVGMVVNIMSIPCSTSPEVWVQAFGMTAPQLIWSLFKPDPIDTYLERNGQVHHKKRKRRLKRAFKILPALNFDFAPKADAGGKVKIPTALFKVGSLAQRLGWYMLIIDAGTELAVNWSSLVYEMSGCIASQPGWCYGYNPGAHYITSIGDWTPCNFALHDGANYIVANLITVPAGQEVSVGVALEFRGRPPGVSGVMPSVDLMITDDRTGHILFEGNDVGHAKYGSTKSGAEMIKYTPWLPGDTKIKIWVRANGNYADITGTTCSIATGSMRDMGILHDP